MRNMKLKSAICFFLIQTLMLTQVFFCFAQDADCLSPGINIDSTQLKNAYLVSTPLAQVVKQLFFTPIKRFLPFATRLYKFFNNEEKIAQLQISSGCHNRCLICTHGPENFKDHLMHMPFSEIERNLDILKAAGVKTVSVCLNFEPFYYQDGDKDICDVIELIHNKGLNCWIITHGWEKGDEIPKRAAEKLASLSFSVYVLLSFHVWHDDVFKNPQSQEIKEKYVKRFSEIIQTLSVNPQTGEKSNVQLEYRYVSDRMEKFDKINRMQKSVWETLRKLFNISDAIVDYEWGIEWSKGGAANIAEKFNIEVLNLFNKFGYLNRELKNIHFTIKMDGNMYLLAEALALESVDLRILMGDLLDQGYAIEAKPQDINEIYWYRLIPPNERILSNSPIFTTEEVFLFASRTIQSSI
ncbi:MAG: radical SAM protein [Candidatus Omnitrophota bacterium]